jgi:hypothetical protein
MQSKKPRRSGAERITLLLIQKAPHPTALRAATLPFGEG